MSDTPPPGRPKSSDGRRRQILTLRGRQEFKDWLTQAAATQRKDVASLVDAAIEEYAAKHKLGKPPMR